jgi:hypothetical protein
MPPSVTTDSQNENSVWITPICSAQLRPKFESDKAGEYSINQYKKDFNQLIDQSGIVTVMYVAVPQGLGGESEMINIVECPHLVTLKLIEEFQMTV